MTEGSDRHAVADRWQAEIEAIAEREVRERLSHEDRLVSEVLKAALLATGLDRIVITDEHRIRAARDDSIEVFVQADPRQIVVRRKEPEHVCEFELKTTVDGRSKVRCVDCGSPA